MPEHRAGTPVELRRLESFLWHDLDQAGWANWVARKLPDQDPGPPGPALRLHAALRAMQDGDAKAAPAQDAVAMLNGLIGEAGIAPEVEPAGGMFLRAATLADPMSVLLVDALNAMSDERWHRFKRCDDAGCRASFYDASRGGAQRWCSMAGCGSRNKMRRLRARCSANSAN